MGPYEYQKRQREWLSPHALLHYDRRRLRRMRSIEARLAHKILCDLLKNLSLPIPPKVAKLLHDTAYYSGGMWTGAWFNKKAVLKLLIKHVKELERCAGR